MLLKKKQLQGVYEYYSSLYWFLAKGEAGQIDAVKRMDIFDFYKFLTIYEKEIERKNKEIEKTKRKNGRS